MDFPIIKDKKNTLVFIRAVQKRGIFNSNNSKPTIIFHKKAHRWNCAYNNFIKNYFAKYFKYVHYIVLINKDDSHAPVLISVDHFVYSKCFGVQNQNYRFNVGTRSRHEFNNRHNSQR